MLTKSKIATVLAIAGLMMASPAFAQSARSSDLSTPSQIQFNSPFLQQPGSDRRRLVWLQLDDPSRCLVDDRKGRIMFRPFLTSRFRGRVGGCK